MIPFVRRILFAVVFLALVAACSSSARSSMHATKPSTAPLYEATTTFAASLEPADSLTPAAGVCGASPGSVATVTWTGLADNVPQPRCLVISGRQRLRIENEGRTRVHITLGRLVHLWLAGRTTYTVRDPIGQHLAVGVHTLRFTPTSAADIWVGARCARPPASECATPTTSH